MPEDNKKLLPTPNAKLPTPNAKRAALIVVDIQNDFLIGSMAMPQAKKLVPVINSLKKNVDWTLVALSQDSHPEEHISFLETHADNPAATKSKCIQIGNHLQRLWPTHCVHGTEGEKFYPEMEVDEKDIVVKKGVEKNVDCYSAFYDNSGLKSTGMTKLLREARISDVYVCGVAFDYCVGSTAVDSAKEGFNTFIVEDATESISSGSKRKMQKRLDEAGVESVHSSVLLTKVEGDKRQIAAEYFKKKKIMPLLQKLTALVLHHKPENPKKFLIDELTKMKESKVNVEDISSSLLGDDDLEVVFQTADVAGSGKIGSSQCKQALLSMGIPIGEIKPVVDENDKKATYALDDFKKLAIQGLKTI
eukprot:jgi/Bigna1/55951/estExt_Genewise1Plus.C_770037